MATQIPELKDPFEPLTPGGVDGAEHQHVPRVPEGTTGEDLANAVAETIEREGPDTVAAVIMEPVQNAGGCFPPPEGYFQRIREICGPGTT